MNEPIGFTHTRAHTLSLSYTRMQTHILSLSLSHTRSLSLTHVHTHTRARSLSLSFSHTQHSSSAYGRSPCESLRGCFEMSGRLRTDRFSLNATVLIVSFVYLFIHQFIFRHLNIAAQGPGASQAYRHTQKKKKKKINPKN